MRFLGVIGVVLALMAGMTTVGLGARVQATETDLAEMGYPELNVVRTADGWETPDEVASGLVLLTVEAAADMGGDVVVVQPSAGVTIEAAREMVKASAGSEEFPDFAYEWTFAGGAIAAPGETERVLLELAAGEWLVVVDVDENPEAADVMPLTVTEGDETMDSPAADTEIELQEYTFNGLPEGATAGRQLWQVTNVGTQPHIIVLANAPFAITMEQVMSLLQMGDEGEIPADLGLTEEQLGQINFDAGYVHVISPGQTVWVEMDLAAGSNIALCFITDRETGMPHAMMGMIGIFEVGAGEGGATTAGAEAAVEIANFAFSPAEIEVAAGTTVTWTNADGAPHTVTADDGGFDSGRLNTGETFSQTFDTAGSFAYHCDFHPNMKGTVVVT
jgi:plastocyanin